MFKRLLLDATSIALGTTAGLATGVAGLLLGGALHIEDSPLSSQTSSTPTESSVTVAAIEEPLTTEVSSPITTTLATPIVPVVAARTTTVAAAASEVSEKGKLS